MVLSNLSDALNLHSLPLPTLNVLAADEHLYSLALLQIGGDVVATDHQVRSNNGDKVKAFLEMNIGRNIDLIATPEYSTPWDVLSTLIAENKLPSRHSLWALGMQSITPQELRAFLTNLPHITWVYDAAALNKQGNFLSCAFYCFKVVKGNQEIVVGVIQFKTEIMGGTTFERNNLICGDTVYKIMGQDQPTNLISLLCADARGFDTTIRRQIQQSSCLILHLQLNANPRDRQFSLYRQDIFTQAADEVEIVTLNWATQTRINGALLDQSTAWGSAFYSKSKAINKSDEQLATLHLDGVYLSRWKDFRTDVFFIHPSELSIIVRLTKPSQIMGGGQTSVRTGIESVETYRWDANTWQNYDVGNQEFEAHCRTLNIDFNTHLTMAPANVVNIERLLNLSCGYIEGTDWQSVEKMRSFLLSGSELVMRITCLHDGSNDSIAFRDQTLARFIALKAIIQNQALIPDSIKDLRPGCIISFLGNGRNFNLTNPNSQQPAVGIYLGDMTSHQVAKQLFDSYFVRLSDSEKRRLVIWYQIGGQIHNHSHTKTPSVDDDFSDSTVSIARQT